MGNSTLVDIIIREKLYRINFTINIHTKSYLYEKVLVLISSYGKIIVISTRKKKNKVLAGDTEGVPSIHIVLEHSSNPQCRGNINF